MTLARERVYSCFVGSMMKQFDAKKSEVESRDECILELVPAPGTIIPSLWTSHPFIHFHSAFYRTQNWLFSSKWYPGSVFFVFFNVVKRKKNRIDSDSTCFYVNIKYPLKSVTSTKPPETFSALSRKV